EVADRAADVLVVLDRLREDAALLLEVAHRLADRLGSFGQLVGPQEQERDHQDHEDLASADAEHAGSVAPECARKSRRSRGPASQCSAASRRWFTTTFHPRGRQNSRAVLPKSDEDAPGCPDTSVGAVPARNHSSTPPAFGAASRPVSRSIARRSMPGGGS